MAPETLAAHHGGMTPSDPPPSNPQDPPTPQPAPVPRRLKRVSGDRLIAGVAGGLGRHFDLNPALVRVAFVVLSLFGGAGVALYGILWLLLPAEDGSAVVSDASAASKALLAGLVVLAVLWLPFSGPASFVTAPAVLTLAVAGALAVLAWRALGGKGHPSLVRAAWLVLISAGAIGLGLGAGLVAALGGGTVVAVAVIATGLALVVGGLLGGARWLVLPALLLAAPLAVVAAADIDLTGGVGERDHRPTSVADIRGSYRLGLGELRLDLRHVDLPAGRTDLDVRVGVGHVELTVPEDVCVQLDGRVGAGKLRAFDRINDGLDVRVRHRPAAVSGMSTLHVRAAAGIGDIEIDHAGGVADQPACVA